MFVRKISIGNDLRYLLGMIIFLVIVLYMIVLSGVTFLSRRTVFWSIYLIFNIFVWTIIFRNICFGSIKKSYLLFFSCVVFNIITYFHPCRFMFTMHYGNYSLMILSLMILPAICGIISSLFLMFEVLNCKKLSTFEIIVIILFLILSSAFFFATIYGYTYEEFFHGGYDLFIDMHESVNYDAKSQPISCKDFILYSLDSMFGRNYSNIALSVINPPENLNSIQYIHLDDYDAANRWLFILKIVSELESLFFILYISFIVAEMFQITMKNNK